MERSARTSPNRPDSRLSSCPLLESALIGAFLLTLFVPAPVLAEEWAFVGTRYQGMGGAGVAVVDDGQAVYWNPGALAFQDGYDVSLPIGVQVAAEGSVLEDVDAVATFIDDFGTSAFDALLIDVGAGNPLTAAQSDAALDLFVSRLPRFNEPGQGLVGSIDASLIGRVGRVAVSGVGVAYYGADPVYDDVNVGLSSLTGGAAVDALINPAAPGRTLTGAASSLALALETIFTNAAGGASTAPQAQAEELVFQLTGPSGLGLDPSSSRVRKSILNIAAATADGDPSNSIENNRSGAFVRGLAVEQVGVSYGHPFWKKRIGIGANVKYMYGYTYNKFIRYDDVDGAGDILNEISDAKRTEETHTASLDLGLVVKPFEFLRFGLTARNVTSPSFDLAPDPTRPGQDEITLEPQVRAGAALWILPNLVVAIDADLTENESELLNGFKSRLISVGTELKLPIGPVGLALRGGVYANTASDSSQSVGLSGGLGLRIWHFNFDIAGGASPTTEKVEAANDQELPSRINLSAMLSFKKEF